MFFYALWPLNEREENKYLTNQLSHSDICLMLFDWKQVAHIRRKDDAQIGFPGDSPKIKEKNVLRFFRQRFSAEKDSLSLNHRPITHCHSWLWPSWKCTPFYAFASRYEERKKSSLNPINHAVHQKVSPLSSWKKRNSIWPVFFQSEIGTPETVFFAHSLSQTPMELSS